MLPMLSFKPNALTKHRSKYSSFHQTIQLLVTYYEAIIFLKQLCCVVIETPMVQ